MSPRRQDWRVFAILGILVGILFVVTGFNAITGEQIGPGIVFIIMGAALSIGAVAAVKTFANTNAGKQDNSILVQYTMIVDGSTTMLRDIASLKSELANLTSHQEILVTLSPEYFGLMSWKFTKLKNQYVSFVQIRKKDKVFEYFIIPNPDINSAIAPFVSVFEEHKAVNTAVLINMKRFQSVCEYYKLS
ncbi:MAG: hypothetical protein IJ379_00675 [Lachnospiraceae bacterium]|nr:hypothetical protein [Lachnospiraceae bacterium]